MDSQHVARMAQGNEATIWARSFGQSRRALLAPFRDLT